MRKDEKIKLAITAGIMAVILMVLVLVVALGGFGDKDSSSDDELLGSNINAYAGDNAGQESSNSDAGASSLNSDAASGTESSTEAATEASTVMSYSEYVDTAKGSVSGNSFYSTKSAVLKNVYQKVSYDKSQLQDLYKYWADNNMDAVRDLVHLDRFEAMSYSLTGTNDFYYYGDTDKDGNPNGLGVAVYANDEYYFGQFFDGKRSGQGTWVAFYPSYSNYVVTEHSYTGEWSEDLPNGKGQEHYDYNSDKMNEKDVYVQNAIGSFKNSFYDGDMYIITVDPYEKTTEWIGTCNAGTWKKVVEMSGGPKNRIAVLTNKEDEDRHFYLTEETNKENGIMGIITGGKCVK